MVAQFPSVDLPRKQYMAYDLDGCVLATRATRAHVLNEQSGGGFEIVLREGDEFLDGESVSVEVTKAQLEELGFISKASVEQAIRDSFPDSPFGKGLTDERFGSMLGKRVVLADVAARLGVPSPYGPPAKTSLLDRIKSAPIFNGFSADPLTGKSFRPPACGIPGCVICSRL